MPYVSPIPQLNSLNKKFNPIQNYIYLYHINQFVILPTYPESISESLSATFNPTNILGRSAPIYTYSFSGPRTLAFDFSLRRDMMDMINQNVSNLTIEMGDDYVDTIIKQLQTVAVPAYDDAQKAVNPPLVAVRLGDDLFIKGVVSGGIGTTYKLPIIQTVSGKKYADVQLSFTVSEVDPYDAKTIVEQGGMRGLSRTLERNLLRPISTGTRVGQSSSISYERLLL